MVRNRPLRDLGSSMKSAISLETFCRSPTISPRSTANGWAIQRQTSPRMRSNEYSSIPGREIFGNWKMPFTTHCSSAPARWFGPRTCISHLCTMIRHHSASASPAGDPLHDALNRLFNSDKPNIYRFIDETVIRSAYMPTATITKSGPPVCSVSVAISSGTGYSDMGCLIL